WLTWVEKSKGKHHVLGPEDVYTVANFVLQLPYIKRDKVFLQGGSFGSHINAHLLASIKKGKFTNIFTGIHLDGGVTYPVPIEMPDMPTLITHGAQDEIAPFPAARLFMEKMLLKQIHNNTNQVQTFVSLSGNHHN